MSTILVTGGTGTLGRLVTGRLRADGHEVRVLSRHTQPYAVDLRDGRAWTRRWRAWTWSCTARPPCAAVTSRPPGT